MKKLFLAFLLSLPLNLFAQSYDLNQYGYQQYVPKSGSQYDWKTGNSYNWSTDLSGNTRLRGYNLNTGSNWNTTIKPNGDMNGYDSQMNYWNYNKRSGTYYNYGTGEIRTPATRRLYGN